MSWYKYYIIYYFCFVINFFFKASEVIQLINNWFDLLNTQFSIQIKLEKVMVWTLGFKINFKKKWTNLY
jgi:hypothetical protein